MTGGSHSQAPGPPESTAPSTPAPMSASVEVTLHGATTGARAEFSRAVQLYAERLAIESEGQELSNRPPGVMYPEITAASVVRAKDVIDKYGARARPRHVEVWALVGLPVFSSGSGILGSYLNSAWQWAAFSGSAFAGIVCVLYLAARRLL